MLHLIVHCFINYFTLGLPIPSRFNSVHYVTDVIENTFVHSHSKHRIYERVKRTSPVNLSCVRLAYFNVAYDFRDVLMRGRGEGSSNYAVNPEYRSAARKLRGKYPRYF